VNGRENFFNVWHPTCFKLDVTWKHMYGSLKPRFDLVAGEIHPLVRDSFSEMKDEGS